MNSSRPSARPALRWLLTLLAGGSLGALWASPAAAVDNTLVSSLPAADSTVDFSPTSLTLVFAAPLGTDNRVQMTCGEAGGQAEAVAVGNPVVLADQLTLTVAIPTPLPKGVCNVAWQVSDTTLQPAGSSSFSFTIANDPVVTTTTPATTSPPGTIDTTSATTATNPTVVATTGTSGDDAEADAGEEDSSGPLGLFRWLSNVGLAILLGSLIVIVMAWPEGVEYILTLRFLKWTWLLTLAATYLFTGAMAAEVGGGGLGPSLVPTGWGDLLDSTPGMAALLRFVFVAATGYAVFRPDRAIDPANQPVALGAPVLAVVTMAFSRDEFGLIEWTVGAAHALAMAVWLGGLVLLTRVVLAGPGDEDLVHAVTGFARLSTPALLITVVTGAIQLFRLDRGGLDSNHGMVLIVKVLLVAGMVFVGVASRQFIAQRVNRATAMTVPLSVRLRRALGIEALIGVVVLALTSWLLALAPPGLADSGPSLDIGQAHRFSNSNLGTEVLVSFSEKVGVNEVRIEVVSPPAGLSNLTVDFIPPPGSTTNGMSINRIPLTGPGVAVLEADDDFALGSSGNWTLIVRIGDNVVDQQSVFVSGDDAATPTGST